MLVASAGTAISCRLARDWSTASKFFWTISSPLRPYVFLIASLIFAIASSRGSTPEMAKKQVCMMVLIREPMPVALATA